MDIQSEVQKIHHQFGISEKSNYEIQKLFDRTIKEVVTDMDTNGNIRSAEEWQEMIKMAQIEAYNQALDDLMNEIEKSSFTDDMKEMLRQMTEILKK